MDERDVLRKAKEVLLERGWWQGGYCATSNGSGSVCARGALRLASGFTSPYASQNDNPQQRRLAHSVERLLCPLTRYNSLPGFNDIEAKSVGDIFDLIDTALASLEPSKTPELVA